MEYDDEADYVGAGSSSNFHLQSFTEYMAIDNYLRYQSLAQFSHKQHRHCLQPNITQLVNQKIAYSNTSNPADGICAHFLRKGTIKPKQTINSAVWSADGRWLVMGTQLGVFSIWEAETLRANRKISSLTSNSSASNAILKLAWNNHGNSLAVAYDSGHIQFFDETYRYSLMINEAHKGAVRGLSFSPNDTKLCSCGYAVAILSFGNI